MKLIKKISFILVIIISGFFLRNVFVDRLIKNSSNSNFSQIAKSRSQPYKLSVWGSSTAYFNFDAKTLKNKLEIECYNFGISGAFFNQLQHIKYFARNNQNTNIVWVINPYEFKEDVDSKLKEEAFFTPFSHQLGNGLDYIFGWRQIYHFNSEHWSIILKNKNFSEFNECGGLLVTKEFRSENGYYRDENPFNFSNQKIQEFNKIANQIKKENNLIIVLPPYLGKTNFKQLKTQLGKNIIDYSDWSKTPQDFHDYIHLNKDAALKLSKELANDLKPILR